MLSEVTGRFKVPQEMLFNSERIIFCDFLEGIDVETRTYKQIENLKLFQTKIEEYLNEYNGSVKT
jgi:hypothetical protein